MNKAKWTISITPQTNLFKFNVREVIDYKDLILSFVKRDFVTVYKQTVLGPFWHLIQPLITSITFYIVFTRIAKLGTDNVPPILFYMSATVMWNYFANCVNKSSNVFVGNAGIFGKVYFPRITVPLSFLLSNAISFAFQFFFLILIAAAYFFKGYVANVSWTIIFTPLILLVLGIQGVSIGLLISSLTTKYRDFVFLVGFGTQLLMYLSPVIYTTSSLDGQLKQYMAFNPMAQYIELFRYSMCGAGSPNLAYMGIGLFITIILAAVALVVFNKTEKDFIDTI